jgi:GxxExxY protein
VASAQSRLKGGGVTERILRVFYDVYHELGNGFLESGYEASMVVALRQGGIDTVRQVAIPVRFRGHKVANFWGNLLIENSVLLEEIRVNPYKSVAEVSA